MEDLVKQVVNLPALPRMLILSFVPLLELLLLESCVDGLWGLSRIIVEYLNERVLARRLFSCHDAHHIKYLLQQECRESRGFIQHLTNLDLSGSAISDRELNFFADKNNLKAINLACCRELSSNGLINFFSRQRSLHYVSLRGTLLEPNVSYLRFYVSICHKRKTLQWLENR